MKKIRSLRSQYIVFKKAKVLIRDSHPDIIHINDDSTLLPFAFAARKLKKKIIWHVRQDRKKVVIDFFRAKMSDAIIFNSINTSKRLKNRYHEMKSSIVYNFIDETKLDNQVNENTFKELKLILNPKAIKIGFVGNFVPRKRLEWVLEFAKNYQLAKNVQMIIIGSDYSNGFYTELIEKAINNIDSDHIELINLGSRSDARNIMKILDILLVPSIVESFGRVAAEAMLENTAVISTNTGGLVEIIEHNKTGIVVDKNSYDEFYSSIIDLIQNTSKRKFLAKNAMLSIKENFDKEKTIQDIVKIYIGVINEKNNNKKSSLHSNRNSQP
jgi:glycosyltransferase involved in cell wall biosynthesis